MALKVGVAREIITPELGGLFAGYGSKKPSDRVNDDLTVTAIALESGDTKVLFMSATVCLISNDLCDKLREKCGAAAGVPAKNVIVTAVHTHTGPVLSELDDDYKDDGVPLPVGSADKYCREIFAPKFILAAGNAVKDMKPVTMGVAAGKSLVGINRRRLLRNGKVILAQNPWGFYDPEMTVISFKGEDGKPVANIIHCTAHNTAAGIVTEVSRDWCGVMIDRLEFQSGAVTAFLNGCAGDVSPRTPDGGSTSDMKQMREIGAVAGIDAVKIYNDIREYRDADVTTVTDEIKIPFAPVKPLELAKEQLAAIENSDARFDDGKRKKLRAVIEMYETNDFGPDDFSFEQTLVRLGPVVFIPFPFEPLSEISLRLRFYSKLGHTLAVGYANGSNSYLPSQDQICRGGYEIDMFKWAMARQLPDDTDTKIINANLDLMEKLL